MSVVTIGIWLGVGALYESFWYHNIPSLAIPRFLLYS